MKKAVIIIAIVAVVVWGGTTMLLTMAKSKSPRQGAELVDGDLTIRVSYSGPYKNGRVIFADNGLVPYGKVWRTGANEATYIETNKPLYVKGQLLKPGKYSVWTIPDQDTWQVIFNSEYPWWPSWGIDMNGSPNRNPAKDAAVATVPVATQDNVVEQFTISIERVDEDIELTFWWDRTLVAVPLSLSEQ
jgi:hypothetical protein